MISVIIPTYKGASCLDRAISSVLNQKEVDFEIIVVDDNSPESIYRKETEEIMKEYNCYKNVKYIKHSSNRNGSAARNTGIDNSCGDIISFLDDDDFYFPNRLKKCLQVMIQTECDIVYSDVLITKNEEPCEYIEAHYKGDLFKKLFENENLFGTGSNLFVRKEIISKNGGFDETLPRQQDYEFLLRQFARGAQASYVPECLVVKAMNGVNNSVNYDKLKDIKYNLIKRYAEQLDSFKEEKNIILINQHKELLHCAEISNDQIGIREQQIALKELGYRISFVDYIKKIILSSSIRNTIQQILWKYKSKKIKRCYAKECNFAKISMKNT